MMHNRKCIMTTIYHHTTDNITYKEVITNEN